MKTEASCPGVFTIMAEFQSHEIANWLETTPSNVARALFETGAKLEAEHAALCAVAEAAEQLEAVAETFTDSELRGLALVLWQKLQALYSVRSHS